MTTSRRHGWPLDANEDWFKRYQEDRPKPAPSPDVPPVGDKSSGQPAPSDKSGWHNPDLAD